MNRRSSTLVALPYGSQSPDEMATAGAADSGRLQTPARTSDVGPRTSDLGPRTSDLGPRTSDFGQRLQRSSTAPTVNPAPTEHSSTRSPFFTRPSARASASARGIV